MSLEEFEQRLELHFAELRKQRTAAAGMQPVFALEHGLSSDEIEQLQHEIHTHIRSASPSRRHALSWVVYAAEIGYRYAGDEYWQTFGAETPGWNVHGSRKWIRQRFEEFHKRFGGAKPTGRWAEWFSNICWPITHAILPKDLQRQLARQLYDSRHSFTPDLLESPAKLGALIAARSWNASVRFQKFAEQSELLGQIATALLLDDKENAKSLVLPSTLRRIATDLERERQARAWLHGARQHATSTRFRGLSPAVRRPPSETRSPTEEALTNRPTDLGVEPRIIVHPTDRSQFEVFAEIPNLSPLLIRFPELREILTASRCLVAGAAGSPLWQGRVLRKPQIVRLATWPSESESLFKFERSNKVLDYVLRTESFRRPGKQWLFRVATDGRGYEIRSKTVRTSAKYLLLRTETFKNLSEKEKPVHVNCQGVYAIEFNTPVAFNDDWISRLQTLELSQSRTLDVWPAGSPPAAWDGEGRVEWLTSDTAILAIRPDHPLQELTAVLDNDEWSRIQFSAVSAGKTLFIELPELPAGSHRLTFRVHSQVSNSTDQSASLDVIVREPHEWTPGVTAQGPFTVHLDPATPSLEQLWEGRVAVEIHGPLGRQLAGTVTFKERQTDEPLVQIALPPLTLPVNTDGWQQCFEKHVRDNKRVKDNYDLAHSCVIELTADELGRYVFECEREFSPVRWALRRGPECYELKVVNDSSDDGSLAVARYDTLNPESAINLDGKEAVLIVPPSGGLYTATSESFTNSILVPPFEIRSLEDLGARPNVDIADRSSTHLVALLLVAELWATARLSGSDLLASIRRRNDVVDALLRAIAASIGGDYWLDEEAIYRRRSDPGALARLCQAITSKRAELGICIILERDVSVLASLSLPDRVKRFRDLTSKFLGAGDAWLCEYSLRLASGCVSSWAGSNLQVGIDRLRGHPAVLRASRAVVLSVSDCFRRGASDVGPVYAGWRWE